MSTTDATDQNMSIPGIDLPVDGGVQAFVGT